MRLGKIEYYLNIANAVLNRATCIRRKYGAVIVKNDTIIGTGYCGSARGELNCCDHGICKREEMGAKSGEHYEWCCSVHAEQNAIIPVDGEKLKDSTIYIYGIDAKTGFPVNAQPCMMCKRVIKNAQIREIIYFDGINIIKETL